MIENFKQIGYLHALFVMVSHRRKMNSILSASCLLPSIFFFLCSCRVDCYARDTLKQGEWLTDNGTTLVSGEFELGFFTPIRSSSHNRYVGIWYKWNKQTVVWVANRDSPVLNGSFGFAEDGILKVWDTTGKFHWNTTGVEISNSTNRTVKLMDSGNLVLSDDDDDHLATSLWESFQYPTDTFLRGMKLDAYLNLTSWKNDSDPRSGEFTFKQYEEEEGHYVIISSNNTGLDYWRSWMSGDFLSFDEMPITITSLLSNVSHVCMAHDIFSRCMLESSDERLVMNYTGELQHLKWDVGKGNWSLIWREPKDKCSIFNACGTFGSCNINNRVECKCLPGFDPNNPNNWDSGYFFNGCKRKLTSFGNSDMFLSLKMMKVSNPKKASFTEQNEDECKKACLNHSVCQAYSYEAVRLNAGKCWNWYGDEFLTNLQEEYTKGGRNLSVRVVKSVTGSIARNCEPCGTNMIPYPLSTGPNCGEYPMYFSFYCNDSTGQVSFKAPNGTYRVASIDPSTRKFVIQVINSTGIMQPNMSFPFNATVDSGNDSSEFKEEIEISWEAPPEPSCNFTRDCKDWPNSICNVATDRTRRCLCKQKFQWNGSNLNCTEEGYFLQPLEEPSKGKMSSTLIVMIPLIVVFLLTSAMVCIYLWRRKMAKRQENKRSDERNRVLRTLDSERHLKDLMGMGEFREEDEKDIDVPLFDLESILVATNSFSDANKLGEGGYGPVYKGTFPGGQEIAVKRLSSVSGQGLQEFKNEVVLIGKLQHRNLVRLRGYCVKGYEKILLYEYMPNKSLDSFLFDQKLNMCLDWEMRFKIILGIARGLVYLHHDSRLRIIHRDLKTSNILLDEEMNPKISDFGLARMIEGKETGANTTRLAGTYGYMSPEYALNGLFSVKSDVFSFGVVLLEIISGKKNFESELAMSLIGYAWNLWVENKVSDLMDHTLSEVCNADQFAKCINIGLLCVQEDPNDRPTMLTVVTMLDSETATISTPKRPAFFPGTGLSSTGSSSTRPNTYTESTNSFGGT